MFLNRVYFSPLIAFFVDFNSHLLFRLIRFAMRVLLLPLSLHVIFLSDYNRHRSLLTFNRSLEILADDGIYCIVHSISYTCMYTCFSPIVCVIGWRDKTGIMYIVLCWLVYVSSIETRRCHIRIIGCWGFPVLKVLTKFTQKKQHTLHTGTSEEKCGLSHSHNAKL